MKTMISALLSTGGLAVRHNAVFGKIPTLMVIIAFSLIVVLAALYMATHYPLAENFYEAPMTII
jgi:hypothetical protein